MGRYKKKEKIDPEDIRFGNASIDDIFACIGEVDRGEVAICPNCGEDFIQRAYNNYYCENCGLDVHLLRSQVPFDDKPDTNCLS